jgi:diacylglycerol diphosphate phosphatase / phosphatidate phosphatase
MKLTAGRPRPDLIARCLPRPGSQNHPVFGLVDWSICTQTDEDIMADGWKSFLSGHASRMLSRLPFTMAD